MTRPIALALIAGLLAAPACAQPGGDTAALCPDGYAAMSDGEAEAAADAFEACLRERERDWPEEAELRTRLGSAHLLSDRPEQALLAFNQVIALLQDNDVSTDHPILRRNRAVAFLQLDRPERAAEDLEIATRSDPDDAYARVLQGQTFLDLDRPAEAVAAFDAALRIEPDYVGAWAGRSAAFIRIGLFDHAVDDGRQAVAVDPENPTALNALCWSLVKAERALEGLDICASAAEAAPDSGAIQHSHAAALEQVGRLDEARALYARAFELEPDDEEIAADHARTREG